MGRSRKKDAKTAKSRRSKRKRDSKAETSFPEDVKREKRKELRKGKGKGDPNFEKKNAINERVRKRLKNVTFVCDHCSQTYLREIFKDLPEGKYLKCDVKNGIVPSGRPLCLRCEYLWEEESPEYEQKCTLCGSSVFSDENFDVLKCAECPKSRCYKACNYCCSDESEKKKVAEEKFNFDKSACDECFREELMRLERLENPDFGPIMRIK